MRTTSKSVKYEVSPQIFCFSLAQEALDSGRPGYPQQPGVWPQGPVEPSGSTQGLPSQQCGLSVVLLRFLKQNHKNFISDLDISTQGLKENSAFGVEKFGI